MASWLPSGLELSCCTSLFFCSASRLSPLLCLGMVNIVSHTRLSSSSSSQGKRQKSHRAEGREPAVVDTEDIGFPPMPSQHGQLCLSPGVRAALTRTVGWMEQCSGVLRMSPGCGDSQGRSSRGERSTEVQECPAALWLPDGGCDKLTLFRSPWPNQACLGYQLASQRG